jgi:hypothetical protein
MPQIRTSLPKWHLLAALGSGAITGYALLIGLVFALR